MKKELIILGTISFALNCLVGCVHDKIPAKDFNIYKAPAVTAITTATKGAQTAVAAAATANNAAIAGEAKLDALIQQNSEAWSYWQAEKNAHAQAEASLSDATAQLKALEQQLVDYESQVSDQTAKLNQAVSDKNTAIKTAQDEHDARLKADAATAKWRSHCLWTWALLLLAAIVVALWKLGPQIGIFLAKAAGAFVKTP